MYGKFKTRLDAFWHSYIPPIFFLKILFLVTKVSNTELGFVKRFFIKKKSYYPVPSNSISFWDIPFLPPLPTAQMSDENQEYIREWARDKGKSVRQPKTVRQETTKYKASVRPLDMYESHQTIGERIQFEAPSSDNSDKNQSLESSATDLNHFFLLRPHVTHVAKETFSQHVRITRQKKMT